MDTSAIVLNGLGALLVAAGVVVFALGFRRFLSRRSLERRLHVFVAREPVATAAVASGRRPVGQRDASPLGQRMQRLLNRSSYGVMVRGRINRAGLSRRVWQIVAVQAGLGLLLAIAGLAVGPSAPLARVVTVVILSVAGAVVPLIWLGGRASGRLRSFEQQLPAAIDAMASTLQAGSSLQQAMAILAREMPPPISTEFQRVLREAELGLSFPDSMNELCTRVPSADLVIFTSAISIQQRIGGDLANIFRVISHTIRERLRIRGETRVLTSQGRYSAYVVGGLPVVIFAFMWLANYQYLSGLFQPGLPRILFGGGVAGMVLGFYGMNKIAAVEV